MIFRVALAFAAISVAGLGHHASVASAQGLIWSLPEDGSWVRYEGTYTIVKARPDSDDGDLELKWSRRLTISSVGSETRTVDGKETACRWVELKLETGRSTAEGVDTGKFGTRVYKVLIPENRVIGKIVDEDDIPVTFLPIVEGYRKMGDRPVKAVKGKVLNIYPMISLLAHYRDFKQTGEKADSIDVPLGAVSARTFQGKQIVKTRISRSSNTAELALSDEVPFGPAKWTVTVIREEKDAVAEADAYQKTSTTTISMEAVEKGSGARSEITKPK